MLHVELDDQYIGTIHGVVTVTNLFVCLVFHIMHKHTLVRVHEIMLF